MQFEQAYSFLINKLEEELPKKLEYHNAQHTKEVVEAAKHLCKKEGIDEYHTSILSTAALFHDAGFLEAVENHEEISCLIAVKYLPQFDYSEKEITRVCDLIMATKMPQTPHDELSNILCDADLLYLGTGKYYQGAENLFKELKHLGLIKNWNEWRQKQIDFLEFHHYFTQSANEEYTSKKIHNLLLFKTEGSSHEWNEKLYNRKAAIQDSIYMLLGVLFSAFAMNGFLVPNHFFDGGIIGISLLLRQIFHLDLELTTIVLSLPLIITSFFLISRKFAYKSGICILLYIICLHYVPYPIITSDKLLISIFGGFFLGLGGGLIIRAGGVLDGIEILALYTGKRTSFTVTEITLAINIVIFVVAAIFFGIEKALYSILTFFTAAKMLDYVAEGIEAYTGVTIISGQSEIIKNRVVNELGRSITIYKGERGFLPGHTEIKNPCDIIFTVITRLELRKLKNLVNEIDPHAFVFANTIKEASGGIIKRRHKG
ncbi:MAG: YitT family protein [Chitinophagaceae bacterium]